MKNCFCTCIQDKIFNIPTNEPERRKKKTDK